MGLLASHETLELATWWFSYVDNYCENSENWDIVKILKIGNSENCDNVKMLKTGTL